MLKFIKETNEEIMKGKDEDEFNWLITKCLEIGYKGNGHITNKDMIKHILLTTGKIELIRPRKFLFWSFDKRITISK